MQNICPVCQSTTTKIFLKRNNVPVIQNYLFDDQLKAQQINRGNLSISICLCCGFIFNADFDPEIMPYDQQYENTQNYSTLFKHHIEELVEDLVENKGIKNARVIEVGCGNGDFIHKLVEKGNNFGVGFDPSYHGPLFSLSGRLHFIKEFYGEKFEEKVTDFVVCRHVIEHISEPNLMLTSIRRALENSFHAKVFFETPDVEWILNNGVIWDFFYEHCSYFSRQSIRTVFERAGFYVDLIRLVFKNQYLFLEAKPSAEIQSSNEGINNIIDLTEKFEQSNKYLFEKWAYVLREYKKEGSLAIWGAGAKGVTFANLFDPNFELIDCVVDINPKKQKKYLPGTGHPIISPHVLGDYKIRKLLVLNPNYIEEIQTQLTEEKIENCSLVDFSNGGTQ